MLREIANHEQSNKMPGLRLIILVMLYLVFAGAYAIRTPAWQAPDEPAHANYIAQVASAGCCPVIAPGDWDQAYLDTLRSTNFAPQNLSRLSTVQYEDHQPPLYYLFGALVYRLTGGESLLALRLVSVVFGAGVVIAAYLFARQLFPQRIPFAVEVAALVAFIPQHLAMMGVVNNDSLAELIVGIALIGTVNYLKDGRIQPFHLGIIVGIGLLTKVSTFFLLGLIPLAILLKAWKDGGRPAGRPYKESDTVGYRASVVSPENGNVAFSTSGGVVRRFIPALIAFFVPALIMGGIWWVRNLSVYGVPDFLGLAAHDGVVVGQLRTADYIAQLGFGEYLRRGVETTFNSFWGQFGWMALPLPTFSYVLIIALVAASGIGWLTAFARRARPRECDNPSAMWIVLSAAVLLVLAQYLYYNTTFVQFQGRYLYPALLPIAVIIVLGWHALIERIAVYVPALKGWVGVIGAPVLVIINIMVLWRVLPLLSPG